MRASESLSTSRSRGGGLGGGLGGRFGYGATVLTDHREDRRLAAGLKRHVRPVDPPGAHGHVQALDVRAGPLGRQEPSAPAEVVVGHRTEPVERAAIDNHRGRDRSRLRGLQVPEAIGPLVALDGLVDRTAVDEVRAGRVHAGNEGGQRSVVEHVVVVEEHHVPLGRVSETAAARGTGAGAKLLSLLERDAQARGITVLRLETGIHNDAALKLYRRFGYVERGPFGDYAEDPLSIFMERHLTGETGE